MLVWTGDELNAVLASETCTGAAATPSSVPLASRRLTCSARFVVMRTIPSLSSAIVEGEVSSRAPIAGVPLVVDATNDAPSAADVPPDPPQPDVHSTCNEPPAVAVTCAVSTVSHTCTCEAAPPPPPPPDPPPASAACSVITTVPEL